MKIDSIRLKNIDTGYKPVRTAEIRVGPDSIITPTRAANLYEYNSKGKYHLIFKLETKLV